MESLLLGFTTNGMTSIFPLLTFHSWAVISRLHQHMGFTFHSWSVMPEPVQIIRTSWSVGESSLQGCTNGVKKKNKNKKTNKNKKKKNNKKKLVATLKKFYGRHHDLVNPYNVAVSRIVSDVFANDET